MTFSGKTVFTPTSFNNPQIQANGGTPPSWHLVAIKGIGVTIRGEPGSSIHGNGQAYWDSVGGNKGRTVNKPKFFKFNLEASTVSGLHVVNTPQHTFSISCNSTTFDRITLDNRAGDARCDSSKRIANYRGSSCGHNTDAFNIGGSFGVTISNARIDNQDDCLALNSGKDITFKDSYCSGGHGISIGSIKTNNTVSSVVISNSTIKDAENGVRIKTYDDCTNGFVSDVLYKDIKLQGITKYGIDVQQDYRNEGPTGIAGNGCPTVGLRLENIEGTVKAGGQSVYVNCGKGSCSDWTWKDIKVSGPKGKLACKEAPAVAVPHCR